MKGHLAEKYAFMERCTSARASGKGAFVSVVNEHADVTEFIQDCDLALWSDPVTAEGKPAFREWASDSGSSRHVRN